MNKPTTMLITMTIPVNLIVSSLVGQTTFDSSLLTSLKKESGLNLTPAVFNIATNSIKTDLTCKGEEGGIINIMYNLQFIMYN